MSIECRSRSNSSLLARTVKLLSEKVRSEVFVILALVVFSFALTVVPLKFVNITPSTVFGESIEGVVSPLYWLGIVIIVVLACYMFTRLDHRELRLPFFISCFMLIFSMRSVLSIVSTFPFVKDTWGEIYINMEWLMFGMLSPKGIGFFTMQYVRGWPVSFILAYLFTMARVPVYTFYLWAPTVLYLLDAVIIYFLFKELANEKLGMVSIFLFGLLNTCGFFPLHYSPQTVGAFLYLLTIYAIVKAYKTRKLRNLIPAFFCIVATVLTHHMTTFFLGISLVGFYFSTYILDRQQKMQGKNRWSQHAVSALTRVSLSTYIKFSLPLSIVTFALWYFYGFIVYRVDATWMLTAIMRLLTTHQPIYQSGYYGKYLMLSPLSKLSMVVFPSFVLAATAITFSHRIVKKQLFDGYLWQTMGWAGAMTSMFIFGNLLYGNYIEPLRALEIITVALFPAAGLFLLAVYESRSPFKKILMTTMLVAVALFSIFSIYRGAQSIMFYEPPPWMSFFERSLSP